MPIRSPVGAHTMPGPVAWYGITEDEAARIGLMATPDFDAALAAALTHQGDQARIGVVTHGADIMGRFK